jgi:hypothetical protein
VNQLGFTEKQGRKSQDYPYTAYGLHMARGDYLYMAYRLQYLAIIDEKHRLPIIYRTGPAIGNPTTVRTTSVQNASTYESDSDPEQPE